MPVVLNITLSAFRQMQDNYSIGLADGPGQHEIGYGTKISSIWAHGKPHFTTVSLILV